MKIAIATAWILLGSLLLPYALSGSSAQTPAPGPSTTKARIEITSTLERIRISDGGRVLFYLLWNKTIRARPIGHAFYDCQQALGRTLTCAAIFRLPLGKITTMGEYHGFNRYSVVITGGARFYLGAVGIMRGLRIGPGTYGLTFILETPQ